MEKEERYLLEKVFLLISYHIRTGLALTALCKSCSQTLEQLTKIYTQPFIPLIVTFFKHTPSLFSKQYFLVFTFSWRCLRDSLCSCNISGPNIRLTVEKKIILETFLEKFHGVFFISNVINKLNLL